MENIIDLADYKSRLTPHEQSKLTFYDQQLEFVIPGLELFVNVDNGVLSAS